MSYSISATRPNKAELEVAIRDELAKVPESQPVHKADIDQAFNAAKSLIDLMADDPSRDVNAGVSGSIWTTDAGAQNVSLNITVGFVARVV